MHFPHPLDQSLKRVVAVEVRKYFGRVEPRPIHPEMVDFDTLKNANEAGGMIVIRVRQNHVIDAVVQPVVGSDVVYDRLCRVRKTAVDDVKIIALLIVTVANANRDRRKIGGAAANWLFSRLFSGRGWMRGVDVEVGGNWG